MVRRMLLLLAVSLILASGVGFAEMADFDGVFDGTTEAAAVVLKGSNSEAYAAAPAVSATSTTLTVAEDEAVVESRPDFNYHDNVYRGGLFAGRGHAGGQSTPSRSYLKFDLHDVAPDASITGARLYVYLNDRAGFADRDLGVYSAGDGWSERYITWRNAPPPDSSPVDSITGPFKTGQWYSWDVTSTVAAEAAGDRIATFVLRELDESGDYSWKYFNEKEYNPDRAAYLKIEVQAEAPVADAGPDQEAEQTSPDGAEVTLDGSASTGGGGGLTHEWREGDTVLGTEPVVTPVLQLGVHDITLTVTDGSGQSDTDDVTVTVVDTTAPDFMLTMVEATLWPPNHKMKLAAIVDSVGDICDTDPAVDISVTSNEPINDIGDGSTEPDWKVVQTDDAWEIYLRAERAGPSVGREYLIEVAVTDDSGNVATASATVTVPHDQCNGKNERNTNRGGKK